MAQKSYKELEVFRLAYQLAMGIFKLSKNFPIEERYSLTTFIRNSSRSVLAKIAEAFRKRMYEKAFIVKLSDFEGEAAETLTWLVHSKDCNYITSETCEKFNREYKHVIGMLANKLRAPEKWSF